MEDVEVWAIRNSLYERVLQAALVCVAAIDRDPPDRRPGLGEDAVRGVGAFDSGTADAVADLAFGAAVTLRGSSSSRMLDRLRSSPAPVGEPRSGHRVTGGPAAARAG